MLQMWEQELTEDDKDEIIKKAAAFVRKQGVRTPATLFLEMHKPLTNVVGHAAIAFAPFIMPFLGFNRVDKYSRFFADRENVERLILEIENPSEPDQESTP
ncbi:MAG: hypothetical protein M3R13_01275 [Armatimonadota bacterium]|nr:hypothetical protein [Armatimonadota bacterium]